MNAPNIGQHLALPQKGTWHKFHQGSGRQEILFPVSRADRGDGDESQTRETGFSSIDKNTFLEEGNYEPVPSASPDVFFGQENSSEELSDTPIYQL